jgi:hypothetical protein
MRLRRIKNVDGHCMLRGEWGKEQELSIGMI